MVGGADRKASRDGTRDEAADAADASRFFSRIGYLVLAVGAPVGVVLHPLGLYVMFSIGVGLILIAAALDAEPGFLRRFMRPLFIPAFLALLAGLGWAALSVLWTPYPVAAGQLLLKLIVLLFATMLAVAAPRENAAATDLYLFPIGVVAGMATIVARALAETMAGAPDDGRLMTGGLAIAVLLFPAMAGLAARGRNGLARLLLIVALCFAYIYSYTPLTIALFAGYLALSFAISDLSRTARELSWAAAALILLSPLIPALAPTISAWIFHARLGSLPAPYRSLSVAADVFTHDKLRLITGHGFATVSRGVHDGILPADTPRALAFTVWYELGDRRRRIGGGWDVARVPQSPARPSAACALYGRGLLGRRRARLPQCRFRRDDAADLDCGRRHFHRRRGAQPVPHEPPLGGAASPPLTAARRTALRSWRSALAGERNWSVAHARALVLDHDGARPAGDQAGPAARLRSLLGRHHLDVLDRHAHQRSRDFRALTGVCGQAFSGDQRLFDRGDVAADAANAPFRLPGGCHRPL